MIGLIGIDAAMAGYRVKYTLATKPANDMKLSKTIARYGRVDLLCIDELGDMQLDRRGAELLFQVLTEREEKASVAIASGGIRYASSCPLSLRSNEAASIAATSGARSAG